ncbi:hypothetical protein Apa02nite_020290 [Actinoplanes palleronii]|uniref:Uncharacterized protein n=1 Tax=Actinoplanes palleronii TaxID=113570 RepID=A0ABQ4B650_9ACTN|nr:hypothetical protein Apa02nite_020290 [Actinoplanes palleronii]
MNSMRQLFVDAVGDLPPATASIDEIMEQGRIERRRLTVRRSLAMTRSRSGGHRGGGRGDSEVIDSALDTGHGQWCDCPGCRPE